MANDKKYTIAEIMNMLPTDKEVESYSNGAFSFYDDRLQESAFVSGCDWVKDFIENKLKDNQ